MAVSVLCPFLMVPWGCLQCVIVAFPNHTHLPLIDHEIISKDILLPSTDSRRVVVSCARSTG